MPGRHEGQESRGIPDGLLVGLLAFLLGLSLLVWTATGLAGLFAHGGWPHAVTFGRTPMAIRQLASKPHDLAAAWPDTPPAELSGYGLFWGLLISQLMVLTVFTVFVLGVTARYRAVRTRRREQLHHERHQRSVTDAVRNPAATPTADGPAAQDMPTKHARTDIAPMAVPAAARSANPAANPTALLPPVPATGTGPVVPSPRTAPRVRYGDPLARRPAAVQAILDSEGAALVVTSDSAVWSETKDARAKLGPVLVYDPGHLCDTPARLHWSPTTGCEDTATATARAVALLAPVRPHALLDAAMADTAETLLRCWLHAAAVDARPFKQVHRWAQGGSAHEAVRILRTHPKAASGLAGLLESALTAHPERREVAQQLTARALSSLSSVHIREACTPNRTDSLTLDSFVGEGGTLYVVGEPIEDPRSRPGAVPLLTALTSSVVEHGRRMAARSSDGRLDPPMTLVLDDVAAVAPLPLLPELLATGQDQGLPTLVLLRSREQGRDRWPHHELSAHDV
ncbi:type VI secretion protein [Streptomyces sp. AK02-01A]|uniref:type VI secretion protein n=1 Tax=Streptomyces sp. AK02-01A TaxID=3028648 RepID=UPI0029B14CD3|nr:type VI secretion protein [Streptomyces sp. AK02-01A]MDX3855845.1 type VI secretion protein [Streptomyces sp. AK02-01A]